MIQKPKSFEMYQVEILQALADTGIRQLAAGGKGRAFCDIVAAKLGELDTRQFLNISETLLPFATGRNLDLIGEIHGVYRLGQQTASVPAGDSNFKFHVRRGTFGDINKQQPIQIPAGVEITTINNSGPVYLADPITLEVSDSEAFFSAKSTAPGNSANATAGVFVRHNFTGYAESSFGSLLVTNSYGIVGGRDDEDDQSFQYRIYQKIRGKNGHNEAALRFALLQVPGIQDVVFERKAGTFYVYVYGIAPQTAASLLEMVQDQINENVAFPLTGLAVAPDLVGISLSTTIRVSTALSATDKEIILGNSVAAAQVYVNNLRIGEPLVINEIADRIRNSDPRVLDVGQPNKQIPEIFVWRERPDGTRYSRFLLGNFQPQIGERVIVETHDGLTNPINIQVA